MYDVEGATKSCFTQYSCVVIVLFNTGFCRSAFSTISFGKLIFRLSVLSVFLFCFESNVLNQDIKICYNTIQFCHVLCLLCNFARTLCIMQKQAFILSYSKKLIYKGRMSNSQKIKECKKRYHKIS